jgi:glutamine cyclotransferase
MRAVTAGSAGAAAVLAASLCALRSSSALPPVSALASAPPALPAGAERAARGPIVPRRPRVLATHPHDPTAFTQGLIVHGGELWESTGTYGGSTIRAVDPATGRVRTRVILPPSYFGEGMTVLGEKMYVLTWKERTCFVYGTDFLARGQLTFDGEGWGLTNDGANLVMSDGTSVLRVMDPATLRVLRTIHVREGGEDVVNLNELEWIHGRIWANVWQSNRIVEIAPDTGDVVDVLDLSALDGGWSKAEPDAVLNGIAFDEARGRVYVTGKLWPKVFEIAAPP